MRWSIWTGVLFATLAVCGGVQAADLVKIGKAQETITEADLSAYIQRRVDLKGAEPTQATKDKALQEALLTRLLQLEGVALGVPHTRKTDAETRFDDVYALAVYQEVARKCVVPTAEAELERYYQANKPLFRTPPSARLTRVTLPASASAEGMPAEAYLQAALARIRGGAQSFDDLVVKAAELNPDDLQGDLGWLNLSGDEPLLQKLRGVPAGGYLGPFQEGELLYLLKVEQKSGNEVVPWLMAKAGMVKGVYMTQCRAQAENEVRQQLMKKYDVTVVKP